MDKSSPANKIIQFPVFQLCGGSESLRRHFLDKLQDDLGLYHLYVGVAQKTDPHCFELFSLVQQYDLVIVECQVDFPIHKIYLESPRRVHKDDMIWHGEDSMERFIENLLKKLEYIALQVPVWACILIGGRSSRMGQPKHLLRRPGGSGESWLERTVRLVEPLVEGVVVSGKGELPGPVKHLPRLPDIPGVAGPLTGVLSAMRWQPGMSWLVIACDMPFISESAINWLLEGHSRPGCWGRLPRLPDSDFCEPLFAWYNGRTHHLLEEQFLTGNLRVGKIASHIKIDNPIIPERLRSAWQNVNTPEQLQAVQPR